jgi:DNA-binding transcriptional MerR regulator
MEPVVPTTEWRHLLLPEAAVPIELPEKSYFKIGEVERISGVRQHTLRQWEREFNELRPQKSKAGQRVYSRRDVEVVLVLNRLMSDRKFTIDGAHRELDNLDELRRELYEDAPMASTPSSSTRNGPSAQLSVLPDENENAAAVEAQVRLSTALSEQLGEEKRLRGLADAARLEAEGRVQVLHEKIAALEAEKESSLAQCDRLEREVETLQHRVRALESATDKLRERAVEANEIASELRATGIRRWQQLRDEVRGWQQKPT